MATGARVVKVAAKSMADETSAAYESYGGKFNQVPEENASNGPGESLKIQWHQDYNLRRIIKH